MSEKTWERYGASTGIAFGILLVVTLFVAPQPPHIDASTQKIAAYYADHRHAVLTAGVFGAFASVAAVLFIAHLRHVFDRVENGVEGLSTVVFATGLAAVAASLVAGVIQTTLAFMTVQPGGLRDAGLTRALYDLAYVSYGPTFLLVAAFLGAVALGMIRGEVATPLLGWFAAVVGVAAVASAIGEMTVSSYSATWNAIGFVAILGLAAWEVATGATMLARPEVDSVRSHRSLVAPAH